MAVSIAERCQAAAAAGFRDAALETIVAISLCECGVGSASGCETGCNPDSGGVSCGILQWYQPAHPGTAACASDPACAMRMAFTAWQQQGFFGPWRADLTCYPGHLGAVQTVRATLPPPAGTAAPGPPPVPVPVPPTAVCPPGTALSADRTLCVPTGAAPSAGGGVAAAVLLLGAGLAGGIAALSRRHPGLLAREWRRLHSVSPAPAYRH